MKFSDLKFAHSIYPRGLAAALENVIDGKPDMNRVKLNTDNVDRIYEALLLGHINHKIIYNTKTHNILDGNHLWIALRRIIINVEEKVLEEFPKHLPELKNDEVPERYLEKVTIDPEEEWVHAIAYNCKHGLVLSRADMKAALEYRLKERGGSRLEHGRIAELSKLWNVPPRTLSQWLDDIKHGPRKIDRTAADSLDIKVVEQADKIVALEDKLNEKEQIIAELTDFKRRFEGICDEHQTVIIRCKACKIT